MIYQFFDDLYELAHRVRHFFKAFACKSFYVESHGLDWCDRTNGECYWYWCPKRKGGDDE